MVIINNKADITGEADILIIGAGVVGLAVAYQIACQYPDARIVLVEKNKRFGQETSSRNSEVIHAGIYYPADSLKAQLCMQGNKLLYDFCDKYALEHQRIGKVIIAVEEQEILSLEKQYQQGLANGVELEWLPAKKVQSLEPGISATAGIWSPNTGIIDSDQLMRKLFYLIRDQEVITLFNNPVQAIEKHDQDYYVNLQEDRIKTRWIINCAGLNSDKIAALVGIDIDKYDYRLNYCKGVYYRLSSRFKVSHLVYPLPDKLGLGIHVTKDLAGGLRLGPNTYYVNDIDYAVDDTYKEQFFSAVSRYLPNLEMNDINLDYAGIRPKLQMENGTFRDFVITEESAKGYPGLINLIGIESPGLTSCLAIANYVGNLISL